MPKYDDSQIGLQVDGKRWAGENYGMQSEESYNKLFVEGKLNGKNPINNRVK